MTRLLRCSFVLLAVLALVSCGGGGESSETGIVTQQLPVSIHQDVPSETVDRIVSIASQFDSSVSPTTLEVEEGGSLVVASDSDSNLLLAGIMDGDSDELSARTTAIALVKLMLLEPDESLYSLQEVIQFIEADEDFSSLVDLIDVQVDAGVSPLNSDEIIEQVIAISLRVADRIVNQGGAQALAHKRTVARKIEAQILPIENELSVPYQVITGRGIGNMTLSQNVELENNIPTTFLVSQFSPDDEQLLEPQVISSSNFSLDPFDFVANIVKGNGAVDSILGTAKVELPKQESFSLRVEYNSTTAAIDVGLISQRILSQVIPFISEDQACRQALLETLFPGDKLIELTSLGSFDAALSELFIGDGHIYSIFQKVKDQTIAVAASSLKCFNVNDDYLKTNFKTITNLLKKLNGFNRAVSAVSLAGRVASVAHFWPQDEVADVTVCLDVNQQTTNCAHSFYLSPAVSPTAILANVDGSDGDDVTRAAAGTAIVAELKALDINNEETLLPIHFDVETNNLELSVHPEFFSIWDIETPTTAGSGSVTVTDIATNVDSTESFEMLNPVFHGDSEVRINIDEEKTFRLVHPRQRFNEPDILDGSYDVFHMEADQFEFSSNDESVEVVQQTSSSALATVAVRGVSSGEATITAKNKISGHEEVLTVVTQCDEDSALKNLSRLSLNMTVSAVEAADPIVVVESTGWPGFSCASSPYYTQFFESVEDERTGSLTLNKQDMTYQMTASRYNGVSGDFSDLRNIAISVPEYVNGAGSDIEYPPGVRIEYSGIESREFNLSYQGLNENMLEFSGSYRFNRRYDWTTQAAYGSSYEGASGSASCYVVYDIVATAQCN